MGTLVLMEAIPDCGIELECSSHVPLCYRLVNLFVGLLVPR